MVPLRLALLVPLAIVGLLALPSVPIERADAATCPPGNSHVWFLGVVYDAAQRDDFKIDVDNFEFYLSTLQNTYCIASSQSKILAFENNFTRNDKTYETASEANTKSYLASFGAAASQHSDSILFFFLSSHGNFYVDNLACPDGAGIRGPGSYSALKSGGGETGAFQDCELGHALTSNFDADVRMFVAVDCSFCGGFSDSLTAASGTIPDGSVPRSSGVPAANRVVVTGCAITTECFGSAGGGVSYKHLKRAITLGMNFCDGFTAPGFPTFEGVDAPLKNALLNAPNGKCTASEWFFGAVNSAYGQLDAIGIQQQFRMKYGFASLADDLQIY